MLFCVMFRVIYFGCICFDNCVVEFYNDLFVDDQIEGVLVRVGC